MINCGTCINVGEFGCLKNSHECLTQIPVRAALREFYNIEYDYRHWLGAESEVLLAEKPICFDCPENRWCGDCKDSDECMNIPSEHCDICHLYDECMTSDLKAVQDFSAFSKYSRVYDPEGYDPVLKTPLLATFEESQPTKKVEPVCAEGCVLRENNQEQCETDCLPQQLLHNPDEEFVSRELLVDMEEDEDVVLHPNHYAEAEIPSGIECWDWYELAMTEEEFRGHMKGNVLKYTFRAGRKDDTVQDLEKAGAYLKRWIKYQKGERTVHLKAKKSDG